MRNLWPAAILALGLALFVVYAFPGLMTIDSCDQLVEARAGIYTDAHPPAMAALWRGVDAIYPGPTGMLVIQGAAFVVGVFLILRRVMSPARAAVAASLVLVAPPVIPTMAVVWKDCLMAGFLLLGAGLLLEARRAWRIAGLVALTFATAVRYNAPAATFPLVVLLFEVTPAPALRRYAVAAAAWIAVTVVAFGCNRALTSRSMDYWTSSTAAGDIVGTLRHVDRDIPDAEMRELLAGCPLAVSEHLHDRMRTLYRPWNFYHLVAPGPAQVFVLPLDGTSPPADRVAMAAAWRRVIARYPGAYVEHRWAVTKEVLGLTRRVPFGAAIAHEDQPHLAIRQLGLDPGTPNAIQQALHRKMRWLTFKTRILRPYLYVLLALLLLPMCRGHRDAFALLVSGLVMEASLFPTAQTPDLRYSHWAMVCSVVAAILLFARRVVWKRAHAPASVAPDPRLQRDAAGVVEHVRDRGVVDADPG
ncbi:MAG TPA: hypothetical protein VM261_33050 [Kofleriaceae bacterium]|nr:hypothetical protein [Kofleriaceae bacterium]